MLDTTENNVVGKASFCSTKLIFLNLCILTVCWTVASFDYYLISYYLKYIPGNIFINTSVSSISENIAYVFSGIFMNKVGAKPSFVISYLVAGLGGALLAFNVV